MLRLSLLILVLVSKAMSAESTLPMFSSLSSIGLGDSFTCAILDDQSVKCWGGAGDGRLGYRAGNGAITDPSKSTSIQLGKNKLGQPYRAVSLSTFNNHTCAILDDGMVKCWGDNSLGQSGYTPVQLRNSRFVVDPSELDPVDLSYTREKAPYRVASLASGATKTCAIMDDGNLQCFGEVQKIDGTISDDKRKLDDTNNRIVQVEREIKSLQDYEAKNPGLRQKEADADYERRLKSLKDDLKRELKQIDGYKLEKKDRDYRKKNAKENAKRNEQNLEQRHKDALSKYERDLATKKTELAELKRQSAVQAQVYENDKKSAIQPIIDLGRDAGDQPYKALQIAIGQSHLCALLNDFQVKCWGNVRANNNGQFGVPQPEEKASNAKPLSFGTKSDGSPVKALAVYARDTLSCAILEDHSARCWGFEVYGRLGPNNQNTRNIIPSNILSFDLGMDQNGQALKVISLSLAGQSMCALFQGGGIKCWGSNTQGELGQGDQTLRVYDRNNTGKTLPFINLGFEADGVSCGDFHYCATSRVNHTMKCWGSNNNYNLGLGDRERRGNKKDQMGDELPFVNLGLLRSLYVPQMPMGENQ